MPLLFVFGVGGGGAATGVANGPFVGSDAHVVVVVDETLALLAVRVTGSRSDHDALPVGDVISVTAAFANSPDSKYWGLRGRISPTPVKPLAVASGWMRIRPSFSFL